MSVKQSFFVLADTEKCTGCRACELACFAGHQKQKLATVGNITSPALPRLFLARAGDACMPIQCHHCEDAPCMRSCLAGAIKRQEGVVVLDQRRCIGCRNCAIACPFGAINVFSVADVAEEEGVSKKLVYKCDLCIDANEPACAANCPNKALRLVDPAAEIDEKRIAAVNAMGVYTSPSAVPACNCEEGGK
ncbi:MAG: 4Fe-4S dicluster domain-containing protein [Spirochaetaceae bacterium]|jgi:electron transport protein HydN|nr:4Fe-4S dicluster domain-containing protein [Spirochaetaceae bacterium]